jgi:hypothetical protein
MLVVCGIVALVIGGQLKVAEKFRDVKGNPPGAQRQHYRQCGDPMIFDTATGRYWRQSANNKGATHADLKSASHLWREAMLEVNLDYPDLLACALEHYPIVGAFKSTMRIGVSPAAWHFAGTIFSFRNDDLRARNWQDIEPIYYGVESSPGLHFKSTECCCLFWPEASTAKLYSTRFWERSILPAMNRWRERAANWQPSLAHMPDGGIVIPQAVVTQNR